MEFGRAGFDQKVGLPRRKVGVRFVPKADSCTAAKITAIRSLRRQSAENRLRARRERRCSSYATEQRDELAASFDHLVGEQLHLIGDGETERLSGLEIEHEVELCRL